MYSHRKTVPTSLLLLSSGYVVAQLPFRNEVILCIGLLSLHS